MLKPNDVHHFACTQCGRCCQRSPEVTLGEAFFLADVFVFQLLLRLVPLPASLGQRNHYADLAAGRVSARDAGGTSAFIILSALSIDQGGSRCSALKESLCSIYDRRPLTCRSVPLHYSRSDYQLSEALARFTSNADHFCDTSQAAPILLRKGKIEDTEVATARHRGRHRSSDERRWESAIFRQILANTTPGLPSTNDLVAASARGALSTSMRVAWEIAVAEGLMTSPAYDAAVSSQISLMDRLANEPMMNLEDRQTILEMRREYGVAAGFKRAGNHLARSG